MSTHPGSGPPWLGDTLDALRETGLHRTLHTFSDRTATHVKDGAERWLLNLAGNDYLGFAQHPRLIAAAVVATQRFGTGASASRLVTGGFSPLVELERAAARHLQQPAAVVFPTGYQANVGTLTAVLGPTDEVYSDALNHASIIDGCRLSRARIRIYPHGNVEQLAHMLGEPSAAPRRLIITESLFSMNGTRAPLGALLALARDHGALLMVDEAHALGCLGPAGRGVGAEGDLQPDLVVGTFGKALGSSGAFVACSADMAAFLANRARGLIYSTALSPAAAAAAAAALDMCASDEGDRRRAHLRSLSADLADRLANAGIMTTGGGTPIVALPYAATRTASQVSEALRERGFLVWAFRPPTVPPQTSLLRVSLSAAHDSAAIAALADALVELSPQTESSNA